jgi:hypothetical protein
MTVELIFKPDPHQASLPEATDPPALFGETLLIVPIRFVVNDHDVLPVRRHPLAVWTIDATGTARADAPPETEVWTSQPVIGFLVGLRKGIAEALVAGRSRIYLTEMPAIVLVARDASTIEVGSAAAPLHEFVDAFNAFERSVRSWLEEQAPQLRAHRSWAEWFPSDGLDAG